MNPTSPQWNYAVGVVGQYVYNPVTCIDFQLDVSEETNLIINVLKYFGVVINDPTIIEVAAHEAQAVEINQKS